MLKIRVLNGFHARLNSFRSLIFYSTSSSVASNSSKDGITNPLMVEFLVNSLGFSEENAVPIALKVSHLPKPTENPQLVVDFLKDRDFDETGIRKVVTAVPSILRSDIERTLNPKISFFQDLGFSSSDLGLFLACQPAFLIQGLKSRTVPAIEILKPLIGSNHELVRFLLRTKSQFSLSSRVRKNLPNNVQFLQSYCVPTERIKMLILRKPLVLLQHPQWVEKLAKGVEETLGIPPTSGMFVHGLIAMTCKSEDKLESWLEVFRSYGWSDAEISTSLQRQPSILHMSENSVRVKLKYFMDDLGFGSNYLATHPTLLGLSLEKRVVPRTAVLQALREKQLLNCNNSLFTYLGLAERKFLEKYVLRFKDELPELCRYYTQKTGISLSPEPSL